MSEEAKPQSAKEKILGIVAEHRRLHGSSELDVSYVCLIMMSSELFTDSSHPQMQWVMRELKEKELI